MTVKVEPVPFNDAHLFNLISESRLDEARLFLVSKAVLKEDRESAIWYRDALSVSPLHLACKTSDLALVKLLIYYGHAWNVVDVMSVSAGEYAKSFGQAEIYEFLIGEGVRTEFILGSIQENKDEQPSTYLTSPLTYSNGLLLDADLNAVMMGWEAPIMQKHVDILCEGRAEGFSIVNVGFGLGIVDEMIQKMKPGRHVIIEAHPDVYKHMLEQGWDKKKGVEIVFGKWQDVIEEIGCFDAVFFDTFGEFYDDLKQFHEHVPNLLLDASSTYSYFNGLAGTNPFFHEVYNQVARADLWGMGVSTEYVELNVGELGDEIWVGTARAYYSLEGYQLPICKLSQD